MTAFLPLFLCLVAASSAEYGPDYSFPMTFWRVNDDGPFTGKQDMYDDYLDGCRRINPSQGDPCADYERDRLNMNRDQPKAMQNYTSAGYAKIKAPKEAMKLLTDFWNDHQHEIRLEEWDKPNTYINRWESDSFLLPIPEEPTVAGEEALMDKIYDLVQPILSNWVGGIELTRSSLYGIRVYKKGSILAPHVDRLPLVTSAIINVAQNVGEPWPLEVYGHDGVARNMTLEPGEMILYESHSVIHGRPFPLVGDADSFYANVFIHFEPLGYTERHTKKAAHRANTENTQELYEEALRKGKLKENVIEKKSPHDLPAYIVKGSAEETRWKQLYKYSPDIRKVVTETVKPKTPTEPEGMTAHTAAATGKLHVLKSMHSRKPELLHAKDANGWTPMHEAARGGNKEVLEFLVKNGGEVNERTNKGKGGTPLWWAQQLFDANHPAVQFLQENGGLNVGPDL